MDHTDTDTKTGTAIIAGTNLPSMFTPNGQAALLFILTSSIAPLRLSRALSPFLDPSPYVVTELMPLRRVYRLFNEIGVRSLPVLDGQMHIAGIITRKDLLPSIMVKMLISDIQVSACRS